jgi:hypothetical protein
LSNGVYFSKNDMYPFSSPVLDTTSQTITEREESELYHNAETKSKTSTVAGQKTVVNKNMIWGALLLLIGLALFLNYTGA